MDPDPASAEWRWHGETQADFACLLLAPGEACPFNVEIVAQDMASFVIHPDAVTTGRESAPVTLSDLNLTSDASGFVRISGTATNENAFKVKNVTVSGVLIDANGQIVSLGSTYVLQEDILPNVSVQFDVYIEYEHFVRYQLYAQAERDWQDVSSIIWDKSDWQSDLIAQVFEQMSIDKGS